MAVVGRLTTLGEMLIHLEALLCTDQSWRPGMPLMEDLRALYRRCATRVARAVAQVPDDTCTVIRRLPLGRGARPGRRHAVCGAG